MALYSMPSSALKKRLVSYRFGDSIYLLHSSFSKVHREHYPDSLSTRLLATHGVGKSLPDRLDQLAKMVLEPEYAASRPEDDTIVIQLRVGDVLENSGYTAQQHLVHPPPNERRNTKRARYLGRYTKPLSYYEQAINKILENNEISRCVITIGGTPPLREISKEYIDAIVAYVRTRFPDTVIRTKTLCDRCNWRQADSDFAYLCLAKHMIASGGGFAQLARGVNARVKTILEDGK